MGEGLTKVNLYKKKRKSWTLHNPTELQNIYFFMYYFFNYELNFMSCIWNGNERSINPDPPLTSTLKTFHTVLIQVQVCEMFYILGSERQRERERKREDQSSVTLKSRTRWVLMSERVFMHANVYEWVCYQEWQKPEHPHISLSQLSLTPSRPTGQVTFKANESKFLHTHQHLPAFFPTHPVNWA